MALLQAPPSTYMNGHDPSWDETIVPVLRQRLQNESQILTKRLSSHSIQLSDDYSSPVSRSTHERRSTASRRPSAIPRPSMTQERSASGPSQKGGTGGKVPTVKRTRTQSTPYPYDRDSGGATLPPITTPPDQAHSMTLSSSRKADDRSSKIPKATGGPRPDSSASSYYSHARMNSTQRQFSDRRMEVDDLGVIPDSPSYTTRNTQILNEPPPFSPSVSSVLSSDLQYEQSRLVGLYPQEAAPRPSTDSVERPFEHWYRGESTRNGGVGELRVGRSEMLDIAQFGHRPQPRINPITGIVTMAANTSLAVSRLRAGSLDRSRSGDRESWFIDDKTREAISFGGLYGKVLDESPLTDVEDVDEGPESTTGHRGRQRDSWRSSGRQEVDVVQLDETQEEQHPPRSASTPPLVRMDAMAQLPPPMSSTTSMGTTVSLVRENSKKSSKSTKSAKSTTLTAGRRTPTSTKAMSTMSVKSATANGTPSAARSPTVGKVPAKSKAKAPVKAKPRPAAKLTPATTSEPDHLASESTTDDTLVDAIPVFSVVPRGGNWDDIILPTVAKKMGIKGYGVRTENGVVAKNEVVLPKKRDTMVVPAPGTFGYDHTKVQGKDDITTDDFGGRQSQPQAAAPSPVSSKRSPRPESPLAFAEYIEKAIQPQPPPQPQQPRTRRKEASPVVVISAPSVKETTEPAVMVEEDAHGGRCCKCVIM